MNKVSLYILCIFLANACHTTNKGKEIFLPCLEKKIKTMGVSPENLGAYNRSISWNSFNNWISLKSWKNSIKDTINSFRVKFNNVGTEDLKYSYSSLLNETKSDNCKLNPNSDDLTFDNDNFKKLEEFTTLSNNYRYISTMETYCDRKYCNRYCNKFKDENYYNYIQNKPHNDEISTKYCNENLSLCEKLDYIVLPNEKHYPHSYWKHEEQKEINKYETLKKLYNSKIINVKDYNFEEILKKNTNPKMALKELKDLYTRTIKSNNLWSSKDGPNYVYVQEYNKEFVAKEIYYAHLNLNLMIQFQSSYVKANLKKPKNKEDIEKYKKAIFEYNTNLVTYSARINPYIIKLISIVEKEKLLCKYLSAVRELQDKESSR